MNTKFTEETPSRKQLGIPVKDDIFNDLAIQRYFAVRLINWVEPVNEHEVEFRIFIRIPVHADRMKPLFSNIYEV